MKGIVKRKYTWNSVTAAGEKFPTLDQVTVNINCAQYTILTLVNLYIFLKVNASVNLKEYMERSMRF